MRKVLIIGAAAVMAVAAAGCGGGTNDAARPVTVTVVASPTVTDPGGGATEPQRMSSSAYQDRLARAAGNAQRAIDRLIAATSYQGLAKRAARSGVVVSNIEKTFGALSPPADAGLAHQKLVVAIGVLRRGLNSLSAAVASRSLCAAPAVGVRLGQLEAAQKLRGARRALQRAGYDWPRLLPPPTTSRTDTRPGNGAYLRGPNSGYGQLTIDNGLVVDGVVAMTTRGSNEAITAMYVRAKDQATITGIPDGVYNVSMTTGKGWDAELGRFSTKCGFERFDGTQAYTTTQDSSGITYSIWEITLHPVKGGNAKTRPVEPDEFPNVAG